nr:hypothetical protein [Tissierella sp.]
MKTVKIVAYICAIAMLISLGNVFLNGDFGVEGSALLKNNWGIMSLVDLFSGIAIFSTWILFREKSPLLIVVLLILMVFFGFLTASLYILLNLYKSKGDWSKFFLGSRRDEVLQKLNTAKR